MLETNLANHLIASRGSLIFMPRPIHLGSKLVGARLCLGRLQIILHLLTWLPALIRNVPHLCQVTPRGHFAIEVWALDDPTNAHVMYSTQQTREFYSLVYTKITSDVAVY